jgi:nodulation protein E
MARRVIVTGLGCLSGLGQGVDANWDAVVQGRDAARPFKRVTVHDPDFAFEGVAAPLPAPPDVTAFAARFNVKTLPQMDPSAAYATLAAFEALDDAGLLDQPGLVAKAATLIGVGAGGLTSMEDAYGRLFGQGKRSAHPLTIPRQMASAAASHVSMTFGAKGPSFAISSACASSAHAIAEGAEMIRCGRVEIAIVGGAEAPLTVGGCLAWQNLRVAAEQRCRPFSLGRDGLVLGEGAAMLVLESEAHATARGAVRHGEILGSGASSDAHHLTNPDPAGAVAAMSAALGRAGLTPDTPVLISSHGTGTPANDRSEAGALRALYGDRLDDCLVIATKSAHGHLLGAGGALEFILGLKALRHRLAPPVLNYLEADPECQLQLALTAGQRVEQAVLLSNSFAFGGTNCSLVAAL